MTITQLKYVLAVAKYKNFTTASEKCFVTQPTLSMQIQKLEAELDVIIFNRKKKPIQVTDIGLKIVNQAKNIVDESRRLNDIVDQQKGYIGGEFKIGIIPTVMPTLLPMFLKEFIKKYPSVNLIIEELTTQEIINKLSDGYLDVAIAATPLENEAIKEKVLYYEPFVGFIPKQHRLFEKKIIEPDDLDISDILLLEDGHCFKENVLNICRPLIHKNNTSFLLKSGNIDTLVQLTKEGLGMTLLPYLHTLNLNEKDKVFLKQFKEPSPAREISLVYHKSQLKIQIINALKNVIDNIIRGAISIYNVEIISPLHKKREI